MRIHCPRCGTFHDATRCPLTVAGQQDYTDRKAHEAEVRVRSARALGEVVAEAEREAQAAARLEAQLRQLP